MLWEGPTSYIEPLRVPSTNSVVVNEVYLSLQGDSSHAGLLCTFVRPG